MTFYNACGSKRCDHPHKGSRFLGGVVDMRIAEEAIWQTYLRINILDY